MLLWVTVSTARKLEQRLGSLDLDTVSAAILESARHDVGQEILRDAEEDLAVSVPVSPEAHSRLLDVIEGVNDEHRVQLLLKTLSETA